MKKIIYTSGVFDLLHASHIRALKAAKVQGGKDAILVVGVATDEDTLAYKRCPVIPYNQRIKMLESLDFVDKVITAPLFTSEQFYSFFNIDLHVQGEDDAGDIDYYKGGKDINIMKFIGRDPIESTTSCISRLDDIIGKDFVVEPLNGGISNMTWKISSQKFNRKYVLKYLQASTVESFSLRHDCIILGGTFALYEYIEGLVGHVTSKEMVDYFTHKITMIEKSEIDNICHDINMIAPSLMNLLTNEDKEKLIDFGFLEHVFLSDVKWVWCHNDLVRENIINTGSGIKFIDWEYADLAPIDMDVASCVVNDVIDFNDLPDELFNKKLISIFVVFQCMAWRAWYDKNKDKSNEQILNMYNKKIDEYLEVYAHV